MKRYRKTRMPAEMKRTLLIFVTVVTVLVGVMMTCVAIHDTDSPWWERVFIAVCPTALIPALFALMYRIDQAVVYAVGEREVRLILGRIPGRRIRFEEYPAILLTNAGHFMRGRSLICPIEVEDITGDHPGTRVTAPGIVLLNAHYPVETLRPGMFDLSLRVQNDAYFQRVGICYEEALMDILRHTSGAVYVLADVREAHREMLDRVDQAFPGRMLVVETDGVRAY